MDRRAGKGARPRRRARRLPDGAAPRQKSGRDPAFRAGHARRLSEEKEPVRDFVRPAFGPTGGKRGGGGGASPHPEALAVVAAARRSDRRPRRADDAADRSAAIGRRPQSKRTPQAQGRRKAGAGATEIERQDAP